ncbi:MAG: alpha/beta fold hydrolase [Deltaproteobacteria bacterium]|jgi:pimeloyl-ACP methyl ester carboxylesterase|nr:alpha/beta fold hydrolase [Deltaproteobacteria bacterium]
MVGKRILRVSVMMLVIVFAFSYCSTYVLYVSPGNFYELGELSVEVKNIPDTTAPVELDIYIPSTLARYPVIIFQHGFGGSIKGYETISTHLASHGFVVVLPQMYGPGFQDSPTAEEEASLGLEIISWIENNINKIVPVNVDTTLLGLAGHSRGGQVVYRMALQITEKVKALAGVDPVDALGFSGQTPIITGPLNFDIPTYILGTGLGPIIVEGGPIELACAPQEVGPYHFFAANPSLSWLVIATTHGHADMIDEEDYEEFCPGGPDRDGMRVLTGGTLAAFFSGILQSNENALLFLSDISSAPVPIEVEMK